MYFSGAFRVSKVKMLLWSSTVFIVFIAAIAQAESIDFALPDLKGQTHRLSDYRGKWVVVNYWATWCPPCLDEIPELEVFHDAHKDSDAVVLGVNLEDIGLEQLHTFVEEQFISYPILVDQPRARTELGIVPGMPTTYVVSPSGEVVARQVGPITKEMLEAFLERQKAQRASAAGEE